MAKVGWSLNRIETSPKRLGRRIICCSKTILMDDVVGELSVNFLDSIYNCSVIMGNCTVSKLYFPHFAPEVRDHTTSS